MLRNCLLSFLTILVISCNTAHHIQLPKRNDASAGGTAFYDKEKAAGWQERDSLARLEILSGNIPSFLQKFVRIHVSITDSTGKEIKASYYVSPDYLAIGSDNDWARIPLTPMSAQAIADTLHCFLPTAKIVDDIYKQAKVKLAPVPMYAFRDSTITMWQHHLIIEGQRKLQKGLIAGIKKDVVISDKIINDPKPNRVAIYGWHQLNGKAIQPVYTGHVNWYVDYSHGIRLVYRIIRVNGKDMDYTDVLKDERLRPLLSYEANPKCYRY